MAITVARVFQEISRYLPGVAPTNMLASLNSAMMEMRIGISQATVSTFNSANSDVYPLPATVGSVDDILVNGVVLDRLDKTDWAANNGYICGSDTIFAISIPSPTETKISYTSGSPFRLDDIAIDDTLYIYGDTQYNSRNCGKVVVSYVDTTSLYILVTGLASPVAVASTTAGTINFIGKGSGQSIGSYHLGSDRVIRFNTILDANDYLITVLGTKQDAMQTSITDATVVDIPEPLFTAFTFLCLSYACLMGELASPDKSAYYRSLFNEMSSLYNAQNLNNACQTISLFGGK